MKPIFFLSTLILVALMPLTGVAKSKVVWKTVSYKAPDGLTCKGYVAYDSGKKGKLPVMLVVHEWWGCNDYALKRAMMFAELGYYAMAVDLYGDGKVAANPTEAQALTAPFYQNPKLGLVRLEAAKEELKKHDRADLTNISAVGYCFGGSMVLNSVGLGSNLKAAVAFHPSLNGLFPPREGNTCRVLICHGKSDVFVKAEDVLSYRSSLDKAKINYKFIEYENATHAFTNPSSTETGKKFNMPISYNEEADKKSWKDMKEFLGSL